MLLYLLATQWLRNLFARTSSLIYGIYIPSKTYRPKPKKGKKKNKIHLFNLKKKIVTLHGKSNEASLIKKSSCLFAFKTKARCTYKKSTSENKAKCNF